MKTRIMLLGLGNFGRSWATYILPQCADFAELTAVVDRRSECMEGIPPEVQRFQDLEAALRTIRPELVINATPPSVHTETNRLLLENHIPVLCEKPIADTREAALAMGESLAATGGFLMIAENYRYSPLMRAARDCILRGRLGRLRHIRCHFCHDHPDYSMYYHGKLAHPLLEDVTIHHLDLARYLSGEEPERVWCHEFAAPYSWYGARPASANIVTAMSGGAVFEYSGTLASPVASTTWNGDWELMGDQGILQIRNDRLTLLQNGQAEEIPVPDETRESRAMLLREACLALAEGRPGETDYSDNLRSFLWMRDAIDASTSGCVIQCMKEGYAL